MKERGGAGQWAEGEGGEGEGEGAIRGNAHRRSCPSPGSPQPCQLLFTWIPGSHPSRVSTAGAELYCDLIFTRTLQIKYFVSEQTETGQRPQVGTQLTVRMKFAPGPSLTTQLTVPSLPACWSPLRIAPLLSGTRPPSRSLCSWHPRTRPFSPTFPVLTALPGLLSLPGQLPPRPSRPPHCPSGPTSGATPAGSPLNRFHTVTSL